MLIETTDISGKKVLFNSNEVLMMVEDTVTSGVNTNIKMKDGSYVDSRETITEIQNKMNGLTTLLG